MLKNLYINNKLYISLVALSGIMVIGFIFEIFFIVGKWLVVSAIVLSIIDYLLLFYKKSELVEAQRILTERLSNGDNNKIHIEVKSHYKIRVFIRIVDEIPHQFQLRNFKIEDVFESEAEKKYQYILRPVVRGEYDFGVTNVYVSSKLGLLSRRFRCKNNKTVSVYPSFIQMRKYELMAISNRLTDAGIKKIRRIANNREFEQIKEYVVGDDYRTLNWKATARRNRLMVNQYQDEKSQQVYCLIDKGRTMEMPFEGMTLLDYSINASLVISNIAMQKQDKAGLLTYSNTIDNILPANRTSKQMQLIMETLYKQTTDFAETNFEQLVSTVKYKIRQRSLLLIFTNFEGITSLQRQMKFLKRLATNHLVVLILFENTEINKIIDNEATSVEKVYIKTIAEKHRYEKKQMVMELQKHGIHSILTEPEHLTVNTINKYLEIKAMGLI